MKNRYKVIGDTVLVYINHKGGVVKAAIDTKNFDKINAFTGTWVAYKGSRAVGLYAGINHEGSILPMHKVILPDIPEGYVRDHRDRNGLNNREDNLRALTKADNSRNRTTNSNNKTGIPGLRWDSEKAKWEVSVWYEGGWAYRKFWEDCTEAAIDAIVARKRVRALPVTRVPIKK